MALAESVGEKKREMIRPLEKLFQKKKTKQKEKREQNKGKTRRPPLNFCLFVCFLLVLASFWVLGLLQASLFFLLVGSFLPFAFATKQNARPDGRSAGLVRGRRRCVPEGRVQVQRYRLR